MVLLSEFSEPSAEHRHKENLNYSVYSVKSGNTFIKGLSKEIPTLHNALISIFSWCLLSEKLMVNFYWESNLC